MGKDFKASNYFSSMQEVEESLEAMRALLSPDEYQAIKTVLGLADQEGEFVEVEGIGKIDVSIAGFIEELNRKGFETLSSCSGLMREHPKAIDRLTGYLSFATGVKQVEVEEAADGLHLPAREHEVYLKPALTIQFTGETDKEVEEKWQGFRNALLGDARDS